MAFHPCVPKIGQPSSSSSQRVALISQAPEKWGQVWHGRGDQKQEGDLVFPLGTHCCLTHLGSLSWGGVLQLDLEKFIHLSLPWSFETSQKLLAVTFQENLEMMVYSTWDKPQPGLFLKSSPRTHLKLWTVDLKWKMGHQGAESMAPMPSFCLGSSTPALFYSPKKRGKSSYPVIKFTSKGNMLFYLTAPLENLNSTWKFQTQLWALTGMSTILVYPGQSWCMPVVSA